MLSAIKNGWETISANTGFILVCLGVFAGLFLIAFLYERFVMKERRRRFSDTHYIAYTALFSGMAGVLMLLEIPLFFAPGFYKLDLSELPVMISTFYLGPVAGVVTELIKVVLKLILKGTSTAFVGDFANFAVGCSFVLPAAMVYHAKPGKRSALVSLIVGTVVMTVFGSAFNALYLIPKFAELFHMEIPAIVAMGTAVNKHISSVWTLVFYAVVPFNLLKGVIISAVTFLIYKRISPLMHKLDAGRTRRKTHKEPEPEAETNE
ncbi:MAG: ECF transporter S component [Clostridiales bacterium]|nr:ECF transporter S component [Clostridiales bacterium]